MVRKRFSLLQTSAAFKYEIWVFRSDEDKARNTIAGITA
jgi:hypothetical protein